MRIVGGKKATSPSAKSPRTRGGSPRTGMRNQPQWLTEWIDDKPRYVLLACGHKDDKGLRNTLIIKGIRNTFDGAEMFCNRCQSFQAIVKTMKLLEYHGIPLPIETDLPPF